jgi:hypothetical protein
MIVSLGLFQPHIFRGAQDNQEDQSRKKKVYTNEDLQSSNEPGKSKEQSGEEPPAQQNKKSTRHAMEKSSDSQVNYKDRNGNGREYWQKKSRTLRTKLEQLNDEIASLEKQQKEIQGIQGVRVTPSGHVRVRGEEQTIAHRLDKAKRERTSIQRQIQEMEEDARKAQALPGWIR